MRNTKIKKTALLEAAPSLLEVGMICMNTLPLDLLETSLAGTKESICVSLRKY